MATLGEKLRKLRQDKKLSLDKVAEATESSKSYLWELETGRKNPSAEKVSEIAKYYGVSIDYLMDETDERSVNTADRIFTRVNNLSADEQEKIEKFIEMMFSPKND